MNFVFSIIIIIYCQEPDFFEGELPDKQQYINHMLLKMINVVYQLSHSRTTYNVDFNIETEIIYML